MKNENISKLFKILGYWILDERYEYEFDTDEWCEHVVIKNPFNQNKYFQITKRFDELIYRSYQYPNEPGYPIQEYGTYTLKADLDALRLIWRYIQNEIYISKLNEQEDELREYIKSIGGNEYFPYNYQ